MRGATGSLLLTVLLACAPSPPGAGPTGSGGATRGEGEAHSAGTAAARPAGVWGLDLVARGAVVDLLLAEGTRLLHRHATRRAGDRGGGGER